MTHAWEPRGVWDMCSEEMMSNQISGGWLGLRLKEEEQRGNYMQLPVL